MKPYITKEFCRQSPLLVIISFVCFVFINPDSIRSGRGCIKSSPGADHHRRSHRRSESGTGTGQTVSGQILYLVMGLSSREFWNQLCESNQNSSRRTAPLSSSDTAAGRSFLCDGHCVKSSNRFFCVQYTRMAGLIRS